MLTASFDFANTHKKVLYVDDEEINLRAFARLTRKNFEVITAHSAKEALEILEKVQDIHIIVSDQRMPEMTGIELLTKAIEKAPDAIRIILTGYTDEQDIRKAINVCGIYRYLTKPWDEEELLNVLQQAEETFRLRSDNQRLVLQLQMQNEELETKVVERTKEIEDQKKQMLLQNQILEQALVEVEQALKDLELAVGALERKNAELNEAHVRIKDSITYAKNIQQAILPHREDIERFIEKFEHFFWAKDVVSGDFYWAKKTPNALYLALGDCTGHGVPGAFMTVMSVTLLNQIVKSELEPSPDGVLDQLHEHIVQALKQDFSENRDGLDIALCKITEQNDTFLLEFSGAHRELYVSDGTHMKTLSSNRFSVGGKPKQIRCYEAHRILLKKGARFYAFTDGVAHLPDKERAKFGERQVINILSETANLTLDEQKNALERALRVHCEGVADIRDDVTFIAVEL
jgi:YesN/AraC family two-component response regulator